MIIKKINLISFGKFQDKELTFSPGFTILEGENEVGKTTIHKFIEGMLFGFLDPTKSRRSYSDDHKKYQPKNASDYRGSMTISLKGKDYRIERNFDKKQAEVKLFDETNGRDLTDTLDQHPSLKMPDIGAFIGISYKLYQNTVSISQLLRNTEKDLGQALVEKLHNITTTKDESISIRTIQESLEKSLSEIGSEKAKTKPLAKSIIEVEKLQTMIKESKEKYNESERLFSEKQHKQQESQEVQTDLEEVSKSIHQYNNSKKKEQYSKAKYLKDMMDKNTLKITANEDVLQLENANYERLQEINNERSYLHQKLGDQKRIEEDLITRKDSLQSSLDKHAAFSNQEQAFYQIRSHFYAKKAALEDVDDLTQRKTQIKQAIQKIDVNQDLIEDHKRFEQVKEQAEQVNLYQYEKTHQQIKEQLNKTLQEAPSKWMLYFSYVLCILIIGFFLLKKQKAKIQEHQERVENLQAQVANAEQEWIQAMEEEKKYKTIMQELLEKHQVDTAYTFAEERRKQENNEQVLANYQRELEEVTDKLKKQEDIALKENTHLETLCRELKSDVPTSPQELNQFEEDFRLHQQNLEKYQNIGEELSKIAEARAQIAKQNATLKAEFQDLLEDGKCASIEDYKQGLSLKQELKQMQKENTVMFDRMHDLTDGLDLETYKKSIDFQLPDYDKADSINDLEQRQSHLRSELRELESRIYELDKDIALIEETYKDVYTLEAMLDKAKEDMQILQDKKAATTLASQVIDELAKEIQYEFAPSLNKAISNVMTSITDGKYTDLKIDQDTNIKILDSYLKQLLEADDFSTGTVDQIYFSMRLGLSKILFKESFPYIFDDTFVNYDAKRLSNVLHLLEKESTQIILFTCHKREHIIAESENIPHTHQLLT